MTAQRLWARVSLCCRNNYSLPRSLKTTWIVNFIASSLCDFCSTCLFGLRLRLETTLQDKEYCRVFSISRYQKTCQEGTASRACLCGACVNNCWIWKFSISAFDVVLRVGKAIFFLSIYLPLQVFSFITKFNYACVLLVMFAFNQFTIFLLYRTLIIYKSHKHA